jgi:hypothetical protein
LRWQFQADSECGMARETAFFRAGIHRETEMRSGEVTSETQAKVTGFVDFPGIEGICAQSASPMRGSPPRRARDAILPVLGGLTRPRLMTLAAARRLRGPSVLPIAALIATTTLVAADSAGAQGLLEGWTQGAVTIYGWVPGIEGAQEGPNGEPIVSLDSVHESRSYSRQGRRGHRRGQGGPGDGQRWRTSGGERRKLGLASSRRRSGRFAGTGSRRDERRIARAEGGGLQDMLGQVLAGRAGPAAGSGPEVSALNSMS